MTDCKGRAFTQGVGVRLLPGCKGRALLVPRQSLAQFVCRCDIQCWVLLIALLNAKEGIKKKLAHYNEVARENNASQRKRKDREEVRWMQVFPIEKSPNKYKPLAGLLLV